MEPANGEDARAIEESLREELVDLGYDELRMVLVSAQLGRGVWLIENDALSLVVKADQSEDAVDAESRGLKLLRENGIVTPAILHRLNRPWPALVLEYVKGGEVDLDQTNGQLAVSATLSTLARSQSSEITNSSWGATLRSWTTRDSKYLADRRLASESVLDKVARSLVRYEVLLDPEGPCTLVHGDLNPRHMILRDVVDSPRVPEVVLIDCENARYADTALDAAAVCDSWRLGPEVLFGAGGISPDAVLLERTQLLRLVRLQSTVRWFHRRGRPEWSQVLARLEEFANEVSL